MSRRLVLVRHPSRMLNRSRMPPWASFVRTSRPSRPPASSAADLWHVREREGIKLNYVKIDR